MTNSSCQSQTHCQKLKEDIFTFTRIQTINISAYEKTNILAVDRRILHF